MEPEPVLERELARMDAWLRQYQSAKFRHWRGFENKTARNAAIQARYRDAKGEIYYVARHFGYDNGMRFHDIAEEFHLFAHCSVYGYD